MDKSTLTARGSNPGLAALAALNLLTASLAASAAPANITGTTPIDDVGIILTPLTREELAEEASAVRELARAKTAEVSAQKLLVRDAGGRAADAVLKRLQELVAERRGLFDDGYPFRSKWDSPKLMGKIAKDVKENDMPPFKHMKEKGATTSDAEPQAIIAWATNAETARQGPSAR